MSRWEKKSSVSVIVEKLGGSPVQSVVCFRGNGRPTGNGSHFKH